MEALSTLQGGAHRGATGGRGGGKYEAEPRQDAGDEPGGCGTVLFVRAGAGDLVHGAEPQPAARQPAVDRGDAKRQHAMPQRRLDMADAFAKLVKNSGVSRMGHA